MSVEMDFVLVCDWKSYKQCSAGFKHTDDVVKAFYVIKRINGVSVPAEAEIFDRMETGN